MEETNSKNANESSLLQKINSNVIIKNIFPFFDKEKKYILPPLLSYSNSFNFLSIDKEKILESEKNDANILLILIQFFINCKLAYKEQYLKNNDIIKINDSILDMFNKAESETKGIVDSRFKYKKYFYNYLLTMPFINISPCCSLMNVIYFNEYYKKINNKQKILNLIIYLEEDIAFSRINDLFGEMIFTPKNFAIKGNKITFNGDLFLNAISNIYGVFNQPRAIIVNGGNKNFKHNFKKNEYIKDSILFKLNFKSNSLLIIHRV